MTDTNESLVALATPRLTEESATAIDQELQTAFQQGTDPYIEALETVAEEIVELLPDDLEWSGEANELSSTAKVIAEQISDADIAIALGRSIGQAYIKRQEGAVAA